MREWIVAARLTAGPVFRAIDRWANISANGPIDSLVPLLRNILQEAGVMRLSCTVPLAAPRLCQLGNCEWWDLRTLMEHVGWKNAQSAMRYIDQEDPFNQRRIEQNLYPLYSK
jgi:hypothetical protein